ncbi:hypothetical protein NIES208_08760 [[Limnothrix rosea] IAM M-220]|nr:hypothetical protein NIES208_08760 [[Limnothrix rosea] IAM M-220]
MISKFFRQTTRAMGDSNHSTMPADDQVLGFNLPPLGNLFQVDLRDESWQKIAVKQNLFFSQNRKKKKKKRTPLSM